MDGTALLSMDTGEVMNARVAVKADVDVKFTRQSAKAIGTLNVTLRRSAP